MCDFLSGIVLRNGDVLTHPLLDSHADLVRYYQLPDAHAHHQHFAKVELTPVVWLDVETWRWRLDEETAPGWWADVEGQAESTLRERAKRMIVTTGRRDLILEGCWILGGDAQWSDMRAGRIVRMQGSATISDVGGSATISDVRGSATIRGVWGSATVSGVRDSATVSGVGDSATIRGVWGSATVRGVRDSATISGVGGSATISDVRDSATLDESAKVRIVSLPKEPIR